MRPAFHPSATISGYCQGVEYSGSVEHVFHWVTGNGPAPNINPRFARIEIIESIAVVHLEVQRWSGKLAGANARASDVFTLLKWNGEWKITHKLFHWHDDGDFEVDKSQKRSSDPSSLPCTWRSCSTCAGARLC